MAAVNEVSANDYAVGLRDWEERRALVDGWLARVAEEGRDIIRDGVVSTGDATDAAKRPRLWAAVDAELHGSSGNDHERYRANDVLVGAADTGIHA